MGNDVSSSIKATRTPIPLDDSACWQLYNGVNERAEPISLFIAKQSFSVECRRSIQFLKTVRHPNLVKFLSGFKTFVDQDSFIGDCVHPLANKLDNQDMASTAKLCLGLYQLAQAMEFLHEKASISHNNVCLSSLYVALNGTWKLGNFECACRYGSMTKKYLASLNLIRAKECVTPEENEQDSSELSKDEIYSIDVYAFGTFIANLLTIINANDSFQTILNDLQRSLTVNDPQLRPRWTMLLKTDLFQIDYIKATELLDRLPTVDESDLASVVESLSTYLDALDMTYFNELLIRRLFVPFMFLCPITRSKLLPRILIPKDESNASWISPDTYRCHAAPLIIDLFSYHVASIRETLLGHFNSYWELIDRTSLVNTILPQLVYGLKDPNNTICMLTLMSLATMVPVLGADIVLGGQRKQIFSEQLKKEDVAFQKKSKSVSNKNSPMATPSLPSRPRRASPIASKQIKTLRSKPATMPVKVIHDEKEPELLVIPSQYTNGHHSHPPSTASHAPEIVVIENGLADEQIGDEIDNDDGQWSDWEQETGPSELPADASPSRPIPVFLPSVESLTFAQPAAQASATVSAPKSLKLSLNSKPKWNPNAPLGSEYEIPPVVLTKQKPSQVTSTVGEDTDDFFKDMTPKVETVELMRQLETMFDVSTVQQKEQDKQTRATVPATTASVSTNKFGIISQDLADGQEIESGNNWND